MLHVPTLAQMPFTFLRELQGNTCHLLLLGKREYVGVRE